MISTDTTADMFAGTEYQLVDFETEGFRYTGSKKAIIPHIHNLVKDLPVRTVLDGFSGTTRVSQFFAKNGYNVISNDISIWSKTAGVCYLQNNRPAAEYQPLIDVLNNAIPFPGWFTENYGGDADTRSSIQTDGLKKIWQRKNTMKLDAIRAEIDAGGFDGQTKAVLLMSLILALDAVDNTVGHFASYLKDWSPRSYDDLHLAPPSLWINAGRNFVFQKDIFDLLDENIEYDLAYYDPPYGSNNDDTPTSRVRYQSYYHIWKTLILNDRPEVFGKAKRRVDSLDELNYNIFEDYKKKDGRSIASWGIEALIEKTKCPYIILSYSNEGRATFQELRNAIEKTARIEKIIEISYKKNAMAQMLFQGDWRNPANVSNGTRNTEYLFLIRKI